MMGLFALLLFDKIFINGWDFTAGNLVFFYFAFISALVAESFIDLKYYIIPDSLSIYAAPVAMSVCGDWKRNPDWDRLYGIGLGLFWWWYACSDCFCGYSSVVMKVWVGEM